MPPAWARKNQPDLAVEKILLAAEKAFAEHGVSQAGMAEIAGAAGCSRGTLYRYFPSRHALHLAYVRRKALEIQARIQTAVSGIGDEEQQLAEFILGAVREVRANPATLAWFAPGASEVAARMARSAEIVGVLSNAFVPEENADPRSHAGRLRRRWIVRVIVSLLVDPGESPEEERRLVERFVVPGLLAGRAAPRRAARRAGGAGRSHP